MARRHSPQQELIPPRLLSLRQAAAYCGVSAPTFQSHVPVMPIEKLGRRLLWDRRALDAWLDRESGLESDSQDEQETDPYLVWKARRHREA